MACILLCQYPDTRLGDKDGFHDPNGALVPEPREEESVLFLPALFVSLAQTTPSNMLMFFALKALSSRLAFDSEDRARENLKKDA